MPESAQSASTAWFWQPEGVPKQFGSYQLLGVLGQGGMGTVYKGYHLSLKRFVAIKVLRVDQIPSPDLVNRFLREMEAVGQMDHPNVVRAADAGKKNGVFYLVMEYLEGADLSRLVAERGPLGAADACELARQAAVGLDYVHQTLVHRDLKPSNLILTRAGVVKILDLGLARLHEAVPGGWEGTPTGSALGTYDYLAPEQAVASSRVDGRADLYSLGCTLFKLLTGRPPFPDPQYATAAQKLHAHANLPLTAAPDFVAVPEALRPVLLRLTAKAPADRYPSAREVAEVLAPFAAGSRPARLLETTGGSLAPSVRPLPSRPPEEIERLTASPHDTPVYIPGAPEFHPSAARPVRRRRWWLAGTAAVLACALVGAAWLLMPALLHRPGGGPPPPTPAATTGLPAEIALPAPAAPLLRLDRLPPLEMTDLLGPDAPPGLVGFRQGDGRATGHWIPGRQQVEISPTDVTLVQLAADDREGAGFTLEVLLDQHPWSGGIGLFWGYQEDAEARAAHRPGGFFARCQGLLLRHRQAAEGGVQFCVERFAGRLGYEADGAVSLAQTDNRPDDLLPFGGAQLVEVVIDGGRLKAARFGRSDLANAYRFEANQGFQPADYRGPFGVITLGASVTVLRPRVMAHAAN